MKKTSATITVQNKKHSYSLEKRKDNLVYVECVAANLAQDFLAEDIADLLIDLPNLIVAEREYKSRQSDVVRFRVSIEDKKLIEKKAAREGYASVSEYIRNLALSA
jgi:hypothetical protein